MLIFDRSTSMRGAPLRAAKEAAVRLLDYLDPALDQVGLVSFAGEAQLDQPLSHEWDQLRTSIGAITVLPNTNIHKGLRQAMAELQSDRRNPEARTLMIIFSDGRSDPEQARAEADKAKAAGIRIISIGIGSGVDPTLMQAIASSPEDAYFVDDAASLADVYEQIGTGLSCEDASGTS